MEDGFFVPKTELATALHSTPCWAMASSLALMMLINRQIRMTVSHVYHKEQCRPSD